MENKNSKLSRSKLREIESMAEVKMMGAMINKNGKIITQPMAHNSMYEILIRGYVSELDSFFYGYQVGEGTGMINMRKQTGSYN